MKNKKLLKDAAILIRKVDKKVFDFQYDIDGEYCAYCGNSATLSYSDHKKDCLVHDIHDFLSKVEK